MQSVQGPASYKITYGLQLKLYMLTGSVHKSLQLHVTVIQQVKLIGRHHLLNMMK